MCQRSCGTPLPPKTVLEIWGCEDSDFARSSHLLEGEGRERKGGDEEKGRRERWKANGLLPLARTRVSLRRSDRSVVQHANRPDSAMRKREKGEEHKGSGLSPDLAR